MTAWITWTPVVPDAQGSRQPLAPETQHCKNSLLASGSSVRTKRGGGTAAELPGLWWTPAAPERREASHRGHRRYGTVRIPFYPLAAGAQRASLAGSSLPLRAAGAQRAALAVALLCRSSQQALRGHPWLGPFSLFRASGSQRALTGIFPFGAATRASMWGEGGYSDGSPHSEYSAGVPYLRGCLHSDGLAFLSGICRAMVQAVWMAPVPFRLSPISCFTLRQPQMLPFCRS